jgi:ubiquitin-conjugating enzyme E2 S
MALGPRQATRLLREIAQLVQAPPEGFTVDATDDYMHINAVLTGPEDTPFAGGQFRLRLDVPDDYPHSALKGTFDTPIFHPNVSPQGDICVNVLKREWREDVTLRHVFMIIRCLLIEPYAESALNPDAARLNMEDYAAYASRAKLLTSIHAAPKAPQATAETSENLDPNGAAEPAPSAKAAPGGGARRRKKKRSGVGRL